MRYRFLRFPGGLSKAVTLSYDDGCKDDIRFSGTICAHGLKCTFNINSGFIAEKEGDWHLTREQIKKYLIDTGNEIAVHGKNHRALGKVTPVDGIRDVLDCRTELLLKLGSALKHVAYAINRRYLSQSAVVLTVHGNFVARIDKIFFNLFAR